MSHLGQPTDVDRGIGIATDVEKSTFLCIEHFQSAKDLKWGYDIPHIIFIVTWKVMSPSSAGGSLWEHRNPLFGKQRMSRFGCVPAVRFGSFIARRRSIRWTIICQRSCGLPQRYLSGSGWCLCSSWTSSKMSIIIHWQTLKILKWCNSIHYNMYCCFNGTFLLGLTTQKTVITQPISLSVPQTFVTNEILLICFLCRKNYIQTYYIYLHWNYMVIVVTWGMWMDIYIDLFPSICFCSPEKRMLPSNHV